MHVDLSFGVESHHRHSLKTTMTAKGPVDRDVHLGLITLWKKTVENARPVQETRPLSIVCVNPLRVFLSLVRSVPKPSSRPPQSSRGTPAPSRPPPYTSGDRTLTPSDTLDRRGRPLVLLQHPPSPQTLKILKRKENQQKFCKKIHEISVPKIRQWKHLSYSKIS